MSERGLERLGDCWAVYAPGMVIHSPVSEELVGGVLKEEEVEVGGTMGLRLGVSLKLNLEANGRAVPSRQVEAKRKLSQPLLQVAPGPWGWARVAESTWPVCFFLHSVLV